MPKGHYEEVRQAIALLTSTVTVWGMWLAGKKSALAWIVGLGNQVLWLTLIVVFGTWGLLPLTAALIVVYTRNLFRWRADEREAATSEDVGSEAALVIQAALTRRIADEGLGSCPADGLDQEANAEAVLWALEDVGLAVRRA